MIEKVRLQFLSLRQHLEALEFSPASIAAVNSWVAVFSDPPPYCGADGYADDVEFIWQALLPNRGW